MSTTQFDRCLQHKEIWINTLDSKLLSKQTIICQSTIQNALDFIESIRDNNESININVLITGSLHLVGGVLKLIKRSQIDAAKNIEEYSKKIKTNNDDIQIVKRLRTT